MGMTRPIFNPLRTHLENMQIIFFLALMKSFTLDDSFIMIPYALIAIASIDGCFINKGRGNLHVSLVNTASVKR